jgi:hypothetical protein
MRTLVGLVVSALLPLAACSGGSSICSADFPCVNPGGGGPIDASITIDSRPIDARPIDAAVLGNSVTGRVCLIAALEDPFTCATTGANGFEVKLGAITTSTQADGSFTMIVPPNTTGTFSVSGAGLTRCLTPFLGGSPQFMTVVKTDTYRNFLFANGMALVDTKGTALVQVRKNGVAEPNIQIARDGATNNEYPARYFTGTPIWRVSLVGTGAKGIAILAGIDPNASAIIGPGRFDPTSGAFVIDLTHAVRQVAIEAGAITIVVMEIGG